MPLRAFLVVFAALATTSIVVAATAATPSQAPAKTTHDVVIPGSHDATQSHATPGAAALAGLGGMMIARRKKLAA